jgi:hypothetical protein
MEDISQQDLEKQKQKLLINKLYHFLNKPNSTISTIAGIPIFGQFLILIALPIIVIVHSPFVVKMLVKLEKWLWLAWFSAMIIIPIIFRPFFPKGGLKGQAITTIFLFGFLFGFFIFCSILRRTTKKWLENYGNEVPSDESFEEFNDFTTTADDEINGTYYDGPEPQEDFLDNIEEDDEFNS